MRTNPFVFSFDKPFKQIKSLRQKIHSSSKAWLIGGGKKKGNTKSPSTTPQQKSFPAPFPLRFAHGSKARPAQNESCSPPGTLHSDLHEN